MPKCYILGAGASYGYNESIPSELRPPLTNEFFLKGAKLQIFNEVNFPDLYKCVNEYCEEKEINNFKLDIEQFLQELANKFGSNTQETNEDFKKNIFFQRSLSQSFYFIYELFSRYSALYKPKFDNYRRLALHYHDCNYNVITLNYDMLLELAIKSVNLNSHYFLGPHYPKSIPIAKIHGSINWINPCKGGIAHDGLDKDNFFKITQSIFSNKIHVGQMMVLPLPSIFDISYKDFVRSGIDYDEPALIPPLSNYKDYEKVETYNKIWNFAESMLREASELIIIGCSIRQEDEKFNDLLRKAVQNEILITVVDINPDDVINRLNEILNNQKPNFKERFSSFTEYARTL